MASKLVTETCDKTCGAHVSMWAGHVNFGFSFHVLLISEVALDSFAVEFWGRISIMFNSPFKYDVI